MRAMRIHRYGGPSEIRADDIARPAPGPGQVLIRVAATSFNPSEAGLRRGLLRASFPLDLPHTLGGEVAGTVAEVGAEVAAFGVGDRVVGRLDTGGAAADYVVAAADTLVSAPGGIPLAHAAALPIAGITAWQAVFEHAAVRAGCRVLVVGAGGGVGGFAVQLARHAGAYVIATAGPRSAGMVRAQGADELIDYTTTPIAGALAAPVDVLLLLVPLGGPDTAALARLVRPGGVAVSVTVPIEGQPAPGVSTKHFVARNDPGDLTALVGLVDEGVVRPDISESRPLTDLPAVHRAAEAGLTRGKVLLVP